MCACQRNFQLGCRGIWALHTHIVRIIKHLRAPPLCFSAIWEETAAVIFLFAPAPMGMLLAPRHMRVGAVRASQMWSSVLGRVWHYLTCDLNISTQSKMMHYLSVTMSNLLQRYLAAFLWKHSSRGSARRSCAALAANITHTLPHQAQIQKKGQTDAHRSSYLMLIFLCKLLTSRCCVNNDAYFCLCMAPFRNARRNRRHRRVPYF